MSTQTYGTNGGYDSEFTAGRGGDIETAVVEANAEARNAEAAEESALHSRADYEFTVESGSAPTIVDEDDDEVSDDIKAARVQVEQTRAELSDTIDAIKERLSPQHLMEDAKEATVGKAQEVLSDAMDSAKEVAVSVTETAKETAASVAATAKEVFGNAVDAAKHAVSGVSDSASRAMDNVKPALQNAGATAKGAGVSIVETIKLNPLPAAVTGIGLAWLIMSIRRQNEAMAAPMSNVPVDSFASSTDEFGNQNNFATANGTYTPSESLPSTIDAVKDRLNDAKDKLSDAKDSLSDSLSSAKDKVTTTASNMAHSVSETASNLGSQAKDQAQRAAGATGDFFQANPLAVGALALLAGAAIGLLIPATEPENRLMGETRDRLKDQATQQFQQVADKVTHVAQSAFDTAKQSVTATVKQEAQNQGLTTVSAG